MEDECGGDSWWIRKRSLPLVCRCLFTPSGDSRSTPSVWIEIALGTEWGRGADASSVNPPSDTSQSAASTAPTQHCDPMLLLFLLWAGLAHAGEDRNWCETGLKMICVDETSTWLKKTKTNSSRLRVDGAGWETSSCSDFTIPLSSSIQISANLRGSAGFLYWSTQYCDAVISPNPTHGSRFTPKL